MHHPPDLSPRPESVTAARVRADVAQHELDLAVTRARLAGVSWRTIAAGLELPRSTAHRHYRHCQPAVLWFGLEVDQDGKRTAYHHCQELPGERFYAGDFDAIRAGVDGELRALLATAHRLSGAAS